MASDSFFDRVYEVAKQIPYGKVTSYGAIAKYLGAAGSARMVGWAMNKSGKDPDVPAHRVVNRLGLLSGKHNFNSPTEMEEKLKAEGLQIIDDKIVGFKDYFWDPCEML